LDRTKDEQGKIYGRLTVVRRNSERGKSICVLWLCRCECGNEVTVRGTALRAGTTKSCGCLMIDTARMLATHHLSYSKPYSVWAAMKSRCSNPKNEGYHNYGGRGITVCDKWLTFDGFWEDMEQGYKEGLTLDRKDNNGNYEKSNCRWITQLEQSNNMRRNVMITLNGETDTLANMCRKYNKLYDTIFGRLFRYGWSVEKAFSS